MSPSIAQPKLSQEIGFVTLDLKKEERVDIPNRTSGLLAFMYADGEWETVIKIVMLDDLARGFMENRPFSGRANRIAYHAFAKDSNDTDLKGAALKRLQLYAQITERYNAPQVVWGKGQT